MTTRAIFVAFFAFALCLPAAAEQQTAKGIIFQDNNSDAQFDSGDTRLGNVRVSNGREIVRTDERGHYELPVSYTHLTLPTNREV